MKNREQLIDGVRVLLERRRYGTGAGIVFYTWLNYHDGSEWQSYGDPWPSSVIPKREFANAIAEIKLKLAERAARLEAHSTGHFPKEA